MSRDINFTRTPQAREHIQAHKASQDVATLMLGRLRRWPIGADDIELEHIHRCEQFKSLGSSTILLPYSLIFPELQGAAPYRSTAEDARIPLLRNCHSFQWSADIQRVVNQETFVHMQHRPLGRG